MEKQTNEFQQTAFEDENFVDECLKSFDENIAKVEAEYASTSKSA